MERISGNDDEGGEYLRAERRMEKTWGDYRDGRKKRLQNIWQRPVQSRGVDDKRIGSEIVQKGCNQQGSNQARNACKPRSLPLRCGNLLKGGGIGLLIQPIQIVGIRGESRAHRGHALSLGSFRYNFKMA